MKFISLFSGIGGLDKGLEDAGMECIAQVEINEYATKVLERHWPNVERWRDIADFIVSAREKKWGPVSMAGGFPCQPVSLAGDQRGDSDERWLWPAYFECIRIVQPEWIIIENVPGLLTADGGRLFRGILWDLARWGYDAEWQTLPAAAFGAPHLRERVFIVAHTIVAGLQERQQSNGRQRTVRAQRPTIAEGSWRSVSPTICRDDHGVSKRIHRVNRIKCLGNSVVPQIAQFIGERILEIDGEAKEKVKAQEA